MNDNVLYHSRLRLASGDRFGAPRAKIYRRTASNQTALGALRHREDQPSGNTFYIKQRPNSSFYLFKLCNLPDGNYYVTIDV
jgi:hypothetical protein